MYRGALNALEGVQDAPVVSSEERPVLRRPRLGMGEPDDSGVVFGACPRRRQRPPSP
ncbi:hypothetical protein [Corynebacterium rouxii]|uniref:Uncharacterized protein n=1 Tax=Corynebacterium rouxii TaxID=2719119 RepID=A0ABU3PJD5_9CORY|nr:hypothetical protein [Corynebacterium rouxii]MDT9407770.1 hypothetical protein [Corynebacterium rouxii]MDT9409951.1 hypothetical protein [Corynebacterium rouxii]